MPALAMSENVEPAQLPAIPPTTPPMIPPAKTPEGPSINVPNGPVDPRESWHVDRRTFGLGSDRTYFNEVLIRGHDDL